MLFFSKFSTVFIAIIMGTLPLFAQNENNSSANQIGAIDTIQESVSDWIYKTSDDMDIFFSGQDYEVPGKKGTYIDASFDTIGETYASPLYKLNISARLWLPRTQKKLNLTIQDFKQTESVDNVSGTNPSNSIDNNNYLIGVQYNQLETKTTEIRFGGGLRFRKLTPDPYVAIHIGKNIYLPAFWKLSLKDTTRYFADYRLDNTINVNLERIINRYNRFSVENTYRFLEHENDRNEVVNTIALDHFLNKKMGIRYLTSIYSYADDDNLFKLHYYQAGCSFRHYYYKNWAYYQVDPAVMWRIENNFKPSVRILFKVGVLFGKPGDNSFKPF